MRERDEVISSLFPATTSLYRKLGWELAGAYVGRRIECRALVGLEGTEPQRLRRAEPEDVPRIRACYERIAPGLPGFLDRHDPAWYFLEKTFDDYFSYLYEGDDGRVEGYVVYEHLPPEPGTFGFVIRVKDWAAQSASAAKTLFWMLGSSSTTAAGIRYVSSPEDALLVNLGEQVERVWGDVRWMTRIVDPPGAIAQRGFSEALEVDVPFVLDEIGATDEAASLADNAGAWRLTVSKGEGRPERASREDRPRMGVGAFAALYTGWGDTGKLERAGLLSGGTASQRSLLDGAFAGATPWLPEEF